MAELLAYLFLFIGFLYSRRQIKCIYISLFVLAIYVCLFLVHYILGNHSSSELIRLLGITKCICTPVLVYICFLRNAFKMSSYITICAFLFVLNILYVNSDVLLIGSGNVCAGLNMVLLPMSLLLLTSRTCNPLIRLFCFLFVMNCFYFILKISSTTSLVLAILQVCFFMMRKPLVRLFVRERIRGWVIFLTVMIMVSSLVVGLDYVSLDPEDLSDRVSIWKRSLVQFSLSDDFGVFFGEGDNKVQMMSQILESHNFMLEILLTYGIVGFLITFIVIVFILMAVFYTKNKNEDLLALTVVSYFLVCVMHPVFTGVFFFQWVASMVILFMYNYINKNDGNRQRRSCKNSQILEKMYG